ncbi:MAG: pyridoxal phosphate-dependent aminotransferase [Armatimonadota bacterium]
MKISRRVAGISPSPTMEGAKKAAQMRAQGLDVLSFAVGEPDFPTPQNIVAAAKRALDEQKTKYTNASGIDELKQAVVDSTRDSIGVEYDVSQVCISNGAKHALSNVFATLLDPGDEVIMLAPYWVTYPEIIGVYGGQIVPVMTSGENDFQPDLNEVAAAVTDSTVAICINSPNNPSGGVLADDVLEGIAKIVVDNDLVMVSDEIYKDILFDGMDYTSPASLPGMKERTIIIDGVAKSYAMTGWRIGWSIAEAEFISAIGSLQSQQTSNANSIAQWAAVEALTGPQDAVKEMRNAFERRRDYIIPALREIPGVECAMPHGAFYAFPDISSFFGQTLGGIRINTSQDMTNYLLENAHVSMVHGSAFGAEGYMRLSFACSMEEIEEGVNRIADALSQ